MTAPMQSPSDRGQWTSSRGFVLAALGSAIGLGNIWRFSYVAGENGGGAFILLYLVAVVLLGLPLLVSELAVGQATRRNAIFAFGSLSEARPWRWVGWPGVAGSVAILCYYPVISGWVAGYLWRFAAGDRQGDGIRHAEQFETFIADPVNALLWSGVVILAASIVVAGGIERGIERAGKLLMPLFAFLIVLLAVYSLSLPGASRALAFLFLPDWGVLLEPKTYLAAIGQAFFSIGLAMGILVTYGSYLPQNEPLPRAAVTIVAGDTLIALIAGIVIFPAVFTHGLDPAQGPTLAFVVLPEVFSALPAGRLIGAAFFLLLLVAALTSVVALLEVPVAFVIARSAWPRPVAVIAVAAAVFLIGVPAALGYGPLRNVLPSSTPLLEQIDHVASNVILPLSGIAIALFAGWIWPSYSKPTALGLRSALSQHAGIWLLRLVIPAIIALVMAGGLGLI